MLGLVTTVLALRAPGPLLDRRRAILGASTLAGTVVAPPTFADDLVPIEKTIAQATLTAALATAPVRDIVITGSNSGVGLAGAKLLTAAGHRVVCACRTQAKADAAAAECLAYAQARGTRVGGEARGAECDLASLASVRAFATSLNGAKLDSLVLNAGVARGTAETEPRRTSDGFEETSDWEGSETAGRMGWDPNPRVVWDGL